MGTLLLLPSTIVKVDVPPTEIDTGLNCLLTVGGVETVNWALTGFSLEMPSAVTSWLAGMVLV